MNGNYSKTLSKSAYILYDSTKIDAEGYIRGYTFNGSPNESGNFNISTFTFFNSFKDGKDPIDSKIFEEFRTTRRDVANELGSKNPNSTGTYTYSTILNGIPTTQSYVDGYSDNQQDVLLEAFYRSYTGRKTKNYNTKLTLKRVYNKKNYNLIKI